MHPPRLTSRSPLSVARALALSAAAALALTACDAPAPETPAPTDASASEAPAGTGLSGLLDRMGKLGKRPDEPWKFTFKDPGPGPRAPTATAFGATIGTSMHADVEALVQRLGLKCGDTSIRAMMDRRREAERARMEEARARGEDAVTAASWVNKRSKREANPQLRFSCPKTTSDQLADRTRPPSSGRLLYVFDDPGLPLRHASYQRTHKDHAAALADFQEALAALTRVYGPPTQPLKGELPTRDKDGKIEFPSAKNFEISWEYADLLVRVNILRYGELVTVGERVEVPHGLRPDAPRFAAGMPPATAAATPAPPLSGTPAAPAAAAPAAVAPAASAPAAPAAVAPAAPAPVGPSAAARTPAAGNSALAAASAR